MNPERIAALCGNRKRTARLYNRLFARLCKDMGYQPYGFDWPTLMAVRPGFALTLNAVITAHNSLPR